MAKGPGWLKVETQQVQRDHIVVIGQVRRWHPGFWWWLICQAWQSRKEQ